MRRPKHPKPKNKPKTLSTIPEDEQPPVPTQAIGPQMIDLKDWAVSRPRRPRGAGGLYLPPQPLLTLPGKRVFTQVSPSKSSPHPPQIQRSSRDLDVLGDTPDVEYLPLSQGLHVTSDPFVEVVRGNTNGKKWKKQWLRWSQEVIPSLLNPYFRYLRLSQSLKIRPEVVQSSCDNMCNYRHLTVTLVTFEGIYDLLVDIC
jgi:hypothetical protein